MSHTVTGLNPQLEHAEHTEVVISPLGVVKIEGKGYTGDACSIIGNILNSALGGGGSTEPKPEMYQTDTDEVSQGW